MNYAAFVLGVGGYLSQSSDGVLMTDHNGFPEETAVRHYLEDVVFAFQAGGSVTGSNKYSLFNLGHSHYSECNA